MTDREAYRETCPIREYLEKVSNGQNMEPYLTIKKLRRMVEVLLDGVKEAEKGRLSYHGAQNILAKCREIAEGK